EVIVFLGASYFRGIGKGQVYGLSARGLAIDTALNSGEEFPRFTDFWIERPAANAKELTIYALLNSRRATGAYRFVIKPGSDTAVDVKAQVYMRENVSKLAIAPLTSMFFFGENQPAPALDFRPEVHDSDGLSVLSGTGEWIWRPLTNPKRLLVSSFGTTNPGGFGLMQRDRAFSSYQEIGDRYELRPSAWVEPVGKWGAGRVELVQIPTPDETNDNVVAYWVPENPPKPHQPFNLEYRLLWQKDADKKPALAWVTQTRRSHGWTTKRPDERKPDDTIAFVVDFEGPALAKLAPNAPVEPVFSADANGKIESIFGQPNTATGGWRVTVRLKRVDDDKPVELRGYLRSGGTGLSETWSYLLPPG
ncbi:MAG: glucan biosynthesis protein G, partial [Pseudomonadota bacterium]|nr:glucan biosynthesis protein G [Pseudomonadota bacterium]